jgi:multiple sugar transport system substrate-binding protein
VLAPPVYPPGIGVMRHRQPRRRVSSVLIPVSVVALLCVPLLAGVALYRGFTSEPGGTTVSLSVFWWGGEKRAELTAKALELYTARHPNVTFKTTWQGNSGYFDKLSTMAAGGNAADLFQLDDNYLSEYAERNVTLDLTKYVKNGQLDLSRFPPSLAAYGNVGGRTVAVAAAENTPGMVFNRSLLKRLGLPEPTIGMTYPQLLVWAAQVTEKSGRSVAGTMDPSADYKAFWLWLRSQGKDLYSGNQLGFTAEDLARWFDLWDGARRSKVTPPVDVIHEANTGDVTKQLVVTGKAATSFVWANQLPELQKGTKDELGVVAYPGDPKGQWARASMYWAASRASKHPGVVVDVINFLVNDPEAGRILGTERGLSSNIEVRKVVEESLTDAAMKASVAFENVMTPLFGPAPAPPPRGHSRIRSGLLTAAENVQYGKQTPAKAAEDFIAQATRALAG